MMKTRVKVAETRLLLKKQTWVYAAADGLLNLDSFTFKKQDVCHTATASQIQCLWGLNARHLLFQPPAGQLRKRQFKQNEGQLRSTLLRRSSGTPSQVQDKENSFIPESW